MLFSFLSATTLLASLPLCAVPVPKIEVIPEVSLLDHETSIVLRNLNAHEIVSIHAEAIDDHGKLFSSVASFHVDERGDVDLARQSPLDGSYSGMDPMGLLWSMQCKESPSAAFDVKKEHFSIVLMIYMPKLPQPSPIMLHPVYNLWFTGGGTIADNHYACEDYWKKVISFFEKTLHDY